MNLTETQLSTLAFIKSYFQSTGTVPSLVAIGKHFGITTQGAFRRFRQLVDRGYIKPAPGKHRGYEILE